MTDEQASRWSWITTLLCAAYVAWICYVIATRAPAFAGAFVGLGGEIPFATRFVLFLATGPIYVVGLVLIAGLILKENLVKKMVARFAMRSTENRLDGHPQGSWGKKPPVPGCLKGAVE